MAHAPAALSSDLCWLLARASHGLTTELTAALEEVGVSPRAHSVLATAMTGELTQTEIARQLQMSQTTVAKWQKQFLQGAHEALSRGENPRPPGTKRETELQAQIDELTQALGEAYVELRIWRKGGALYPTSTNSTRNAGRSA